MEVNFGSRYQDIHNNVYKLVGAANSYDKKSSVFLFAPVHAGTVGDVFYITKEAADQSFFPVSRYF